MSLPPISVDGSNADDSALHILSASSAHQIPISSANPPSTPDQPPTSITVTTPNTNNTTPTRAPFQEFRIDEDLWDTRIQDDGTEKDKMPAQTYKSKQIPAFRPTKKYYFHLSSIAIDMIDIFKKYPKEWPRVPKNVTDVKTSIIKILLSMREGGGGDKLYKLDQTRFLYSLRNQWGGADVAAMTDGDKLRVFGLLLAREENKYIAQRLCDRIKDRQHFEDPRFRLQEMMQKLALDFNNEDIRVELPPDAEDLDDFVLLNPNDPCRIKIMRDCEYSVC